VQERPPLSRSTGQNHEIQPATHVRLPKAIRCTFTLNMETEMFAETLDIILNIGGGSSPEAEMSHNELSQFAQFKMHSVCELQNAVTRI
jgi:hypothetical protein